jgi:hypothetical protein
MQNIFPVGQPTERAVSMNIPVGSPPGIQFHSWQAIPVGVPWRSAHRKTIHVGHFAIPVGFTLTGLVAFLVVVDPSLSLFSLSRTSGGPRHSSTVKQIITMQCHFCFLFLVDGLHVQVDTQVVTLPTVHPRNERHTCTALAVGIAMGIPTIANISAHVSSTLQQQQPMVLSCGGSDSPGCTSFLCVAMWCEPCFQVSTAAM